MVQPSLNPGFLKNEDIPFLVYCLSTAFMVFFSVHAIQNWPGYWAQISISFACLIPLLLVLIRFFINWDEIKKFRREIGFVLALGFLGMVNILLSEAQWVTFKAMNLFLMSGVGIYFVSSVLFREKRNIIIFYYLCTLCFVFLVAWGLFEFARGFGISSQRIQLFSSNPIPAGSLIILLSIGPLLQLPQSSRNVSYFLILILVLGGALIFLIGQRGSILALLVMSTLAGFANIKKFWAYLLVFVLLLGGGIIFKKELPYLYKSKLVNWESALIRLEYYRIAYQVVKDKPLFGIGFSAPITRYIPYDYKSKFYPSDREFSFSSVTRGVQTFDNMVLCLIAEAGTLFALIYLGLFVCLLRNSLSLIRSMPHARYAVTVVWTLLAGFLVNSMTFDSLRYPQLNWLFHSIIGFGMNLSFLYNEKVFEDEHGGYPKLGSIFNFYISKIMLRTP